MLLRFTVSLLQILGKYFYKHRTVQYSYHLGSIDDNNLAQLISDTPSRSILLLEDIDCAFPSRDADDDDEDYRDARSQVTLSGLLNVLDSVTSEEGRITFATVSCHHP